MEFFEVWNEPNISLFLNPQWKGLQNKAAPRYRRMVNAVFEGVRIGNRSAMVIAGSTAPFGDDPPNDIRTRPLKFMRELLCLGGGLERNCKKTTKFDIYSHHPINIYGGPRRSGQSPDDASAVVDLRRVKQTLRAAEKRGTVSKGHHPLWSTEMWWETEPPDRTNGFAMPMVERFVAETAYLLWKLGVKTNIWYQLVDSPLGDNGSDGLQAGFYFSDGTPKPTLSALRFPFVAVRTSKKSVRGWTVPPEAGTLLVEKKEGEDWKVVKRLSVSKRKPTNVRVLLRDNPDLRASIAGLTSRPWSLAWNAEKRNRRGAPWRSSSSSRQISGPIPSVLAPYLESSP